MDPAAAKLIGAGLATIALAGVGVLGAFDDYLNAKTGEGIRVRQKLSAISTAVNASTCPISTPTSRS